MLTVPICKKLAVAMTAVGVLASALTACSSSSDSDGNGSGGDGGLPSKIKIGIATSKTGDFAEIGGEYLQGIKLATTLINDSDLLGGSKISLDVKDTASTPATASSVISQFTSSKPVAIVGLVTSPEALAAAPIAQRASIPLIANCAPPGLLDVGDHVFSSAQVFSSSVPLLVKRIAASGVKKVGVIYASDIPTLADYNKLLKKQLPAAGVQITQSLGTPNSATDFSAVATRAVSDNPDAVVVDTASVSVLSIVQALHNSGFKGKIFGSQAAASLQGSPAVANGVQFPTEWVAGIDNPENKKFLAAFAKANPKSQPTFETVDGYDQMYFLAKALVKAGNTKASALLTALGDVGKAGLTGPPGAISYGGKGGRQYSTEGVFVEVQGGKLQLVKS